MSGLGLIRRTDEERAEQSARRSASAVARHAKDRQRVLTYLAENPGGVAPCLAAPLAILRALLLRELVEVRFHLTPRGRRQLGADGG